MRQSISKDFPLYYSPITRINQSEAKTPKGKKILPANIYTNEHPDFFKLDYMKEKGYHNPYLSEVIKVDRSEQFKKMESNADRIELINFLKSNRKFSQDPKMLKVIQSEFDLEMYNKRQKIKEERKNKKKESKVYYSSEHGEPKYYQFINKLEDFVPKISFHNKKYLDTKDNISLGKYNVSKENFNKIKNLRCEIEPQKSCYLSNCNDYQIYEAQSRNTNKEFLNKRKDIIKKSLINGQKVQICIPPIRNERWPSFYENYLLLRAKNNGFRRKGGLFTEFTNKNIGSINVNKRELKERLKKEKEEREEKKHYKTVNNSLSN